MICVKLRLQITPCVFKLHFTMFHMFINIFGSHWWFKITMHIGRDFLFREQKMNHPKHSNQKKHKNIIKSDVNYHSIVPTKMKFARVIHPFKAGESSRAILSILRHWSLCRNLFILFISNLIGSYWLKIFAILLRFLHWRYRIFYPCFFLFEISCTEIDTSQTRNLI